MLCVLQVFPHLRSSGLSSSAFFRSFLICVLQVFPHLRSSGLSSSAFFRSFLICVLQVFPHLRSSGLSSAFFRSFLICVLQVFPHLRSSGLSSQSNSMAPLSVLPRSHLSANVRQNLISLPSGKSAPNFRNHYSRTV